MSEVPVLMKNPTNRAAKSLRLNDVIALGGKPQTVKRIGKIAGGAKVTISTDQGETWHFESDEMVQALKLAQTSSGTEGEYARQVVRKPRQPRLARESVPEQTLPKTHKPRFLPPKV